MKQHASANFIGLPLQFFQEKIQEIRTALFIPINDSILKLPAHIVHVLKSDDAGHIWFTIPKPVQHIQEFDKEFPAKLDFFKKGKSFYMKAEGKATIITHSEERGWDGLPEEIKQELKNERTVLLEMKIDTASYFEAIEKPSPNWIRNSGTQIWNWLLNPQPANGEPQLVAIPIRAMRDPAKLGAKAYS